MRAALDRPQQQAEIDLVLGQRAARPALAPAAEGEHHRNEVLAGLDAEARERLRADLAAYHGHHAGPAGLCIRREYLAILGRRR